MCEPCKDPLTWPQTMALLTVTLGLAISNQRQAELHKSNLDALRRTQNLRSTVSTNIKVDPPGFPRPNPQNPVPNTFVAPPQLERSGPER